MHVRQQTFADLLSVLNPHYQLKLLKIFAKNVIKEKKARQIENALACVCFFKHTKTLKTDTYQKANKIALKINTKIFSFFSMRLFAQSFTLSIFIFCL